MSTILAAAQSLSEHEWSNLEKPSGNVAWSSRLSDPFPTSWPLADNDKQLVVYAVANGFDLEGRMRDGEIVGPVWAKIRLLPAPKISVLMPKLIVSSRQEIQGVRPLRGDESARLKIDPAELLMAPRSVAGDAQLKAYYCLRRSLGSIPKLAETEHAAFFAWLGCK